MTATSDWDRMVKEECQKRKALLAENHPCPCCGETTLQPMGGNKTCWWECPCGSYSPMSPTWEEALAAPEWLEVDPELNARMSPPVGG